MTKIKKKITIALIFALLITSGCWDYRESEDLGIVGSFSLDKDKENNKYIMDAEFLKPTGGTEPKVDSNIISIEGETVFDCARNMIAKSGLKIYWGHTHFLIISEEVAKEGLSNIVDFISRDAEARGNIQIIVSKEKTAREILKYKSKMFDSISGFLIDAFQQSDSISKFPKLEVWQLIKELLSDGCPLLPAIMLTRHNEEIIPKLTGSAVFKGDKFIEFTNERETRNVLFVQDKMNGGLIIINDFPSENEAVVLEIISSKTKLKVKVKSNSKEPLIKINVNPKVEIAEVRGGAEFINKEGIEKLKKHSEEFLKKQIEEVIIKCQKEYKSDIFGFKKRIQIDQPDLWKKINKNWDEVFADLETDVNVELDIKGSANLKKNIRLGGEK